MKKILLFSVIIFTAFIFSNSLKNNYHTMQDSEKIAQIITPIVDIEESENASFLMTIIRKSAHIIEFFVLGFLSACWYYISFKQNKYFGHLLFFLFSVGVIDEFIQSFTNRNSSVADVLLDFAGAVFGVIFSFLFFKFKKLLKNKENSNK